MDAIYRRHGYYLNGVVNVSFPGESGGERMAEIMAGLRAEAPAEVAAEATETEAAAE